MKFEHRKPNPKLAEFRHRISLCTAPIIGESGLPILERSEVISLRAIIEQKDGFMVTPDGFGPQMSEKLFTHAITFRDPRGLRITSSAWVYRQTVISVPQWFKVKRVWHIEHTKIGRIAMLFCNIVIQSDSAPVPVGESDLIRITTVNMP